MLRCYAGVDNVDYIDYIDYICVANSKYAVNCLDES